MRKIFSAVLAALFVLLQSGFLPAAAIEFSARPDDVEITVVSPADLSQAPPNDSDLSSEKIDQLTNSLPADQGLETPPLNRPATSPTAQKIVALAPDISATHATRPRTELTSDSALIQTKTAEISPAHAPNALPQEYSQTAPGVQTKHTTIAGISQAGIIISQNPSAKDIMATEARQNAFWDGLETTPRITGLTNGKTTTARQKSPVSRLRKFVAQSPLAIFATAATPPAPAISTLMKTFSIVAHLSPYLKIGGVAVAAYFGNRLAARIIDRAGKERDWDKDKISLYKSISVIASSAAAVVFALPILGVSLNHIVAAAGVTSVLISIAAGDVINNFFEAGRVLIAQPFGIGDRIKIGTTNTQEYEVRTIGMHDLMLTGTDGSEMPMPYTNLSQSAVTVVQRNPIARELESLPIKARIKARLEVFLGILDFLKKDLPKAGIKSILLATSSYIVAAVTTYFRFSGPFVWLAPVISPIHSAAIIAATVTTAKIAQPLMRRIGERFFWSSQKTAAVRIFIQAAIWIIGGGLALKSLGTSWEALGTGIGFISLGVGLVSQNIISGFWRWIIIRFGQAFGFNCALKIGDDILSNGVRGVVSDINFYYIILTLADGTKSYIHYSIALPFTKFPAAQDPMTQTDNANR